MKKRAKFISIIVLTLVFLFSTAMFVGCSNKGNVDLTTVEASVGENMLKKDAKKVFVIESVIDIEDYIVKIDGAKRYSVHFNYTDSKGESKTDVVKGVTYYFMNKGTYEMVYTVELSSGYVRQSMEIEVQSKGLSITTNKYPLVYEKGTTVLLKALIVNANPYCSETNEFKFEKVDFYETELNLQETVKEATKYTKNLEGEKKIEFDKAGTYEFTISCTYEDDYATGIIKVVVVDEAKKGNDEYVLKNSDGSYASSNAEIEGNIVKLTQADYYSASYLVLDGEYYDEDVIRVDFKGQNCPQIGILTQPIQDAYNPYALYGGKGFTFSMEYSYKDMFSIWGDKVTTGVGRFSGTNMHNGNTSTGFFGLENFDKDKYYTIELNLSTTSAPDSINVFRLAILEIENYGTPEQSYKKVYPTEEQSAKYFEVPAGSSKEYESGKIVFYGSRYDDITFKIYKPTGRVDVDSFVRDGNTVTWGNMDGVVYYVSTDGSKYTEQTENSYTFSEFYENKTPLYVIAEKPEGYLAIDRSSNNQKKYYNAAIYNNVVPEETVPYEDTKGEFIFADAKDSKFTKSPDQSKTHVNISLLKKGQTVLNWVRTKTEYAPGTYAMMSFKGSNFPGLVLFGTNEETMSTEHDKTEGIGFYLDSNSGGRYYVNTNGTAEIAAFSPKSYLDRGYLNAGHAAYFGEDVIAGNKIRNFVVIMGVENVEGGVELNYVLFREAYDETLELVQDMKYFIEGENLNKGSITVGCTRHQQGTTFTYKWYEPQSSFEGALALLENQYGTIYQRSPLDASEIEFVGKGGVSVNSNGTFDTVKDDTYDVEINFGNITTMNFASTKSEYMPGTYIMTEYVGANIPGGIFFGVQDIGQNTVTDYRWKAAQIAGVGIVSDDAMGANSFYKIAADTSDAVTGYLGGKGGRFSRGYTIGNKNNFPDSVDADGNPLNREKTYVIIAGANNTENGVLLEYLLFEKDEAEGTLTFIERRTQELADVVMEEGKIAFCTSVNANITPKFKLYTPSDRTGIIQALSEVYGFNYADPVLSADDFVVSGSSVGVSVDQNNTFDNVNDDAYIVNVPFVSASSMNYARTKTDYLPGTYIMTEFLGSQFPNLVLFGVGDITGMAVGSAGNGRTFGASGVTLYGDESNQTNIYYKDTATTAAPTNQVTLGAVKEGLFSRGYFYGNEGNYPGSTGNLNKTYVLIAGADNVNTAIRVEYFLFVKDDTTGALTLLQRMVGDIANAQMETGGIAFATSTDVAKGINIKLYEPNTRAKILEKLDSVYGVKFFDPTLTMDDFTGMGISVSIDQNNTFNNNDDDSYNVSIAFGSTSKLNYARTKKNYAAGTYILAEFTGNAFPTNIIFGSGEITSGTIPTAGNGALFAASGVGLYGDEAHNAFAFYKASATTTAATTTNMSSGTGNAFFCRGYFWENTGWFGAGVVGNKSKTYVLLAGAYNSDNGAVVEYALYEKNTTTNTLTHLQTLAKELSGVTVNEGGIVFATSVDVGNAIKMKLYEPDTKQKLTEKLETLYTLPSA